MWKCNDCGSNKIGETRFSYGAVTFECEECGNFSDDLEDIATLEEEE